MKRTLTGAAPTSPPPSTTGPAGGASPSTVPLPSTGAGLTTGPPPLAAPPLPGPPDARVLLPRRTRGAAVPVAIACTATCTATVATSGTAATRRVAVRGARVLEVAAGRMRVAVDRPGAAPLRVRSSTTGLATLACTTTCTARTRITVRGHTLAEGSATLRHAGQTTLTTRPTGRAGSGGRAVVTTTLTGAGPAQTARQVLSATAAPSAGR